MPYFIYKNKILNLNFYLIIIIYTNEKNRYKLNFFQVNICNELFFFL